MRRETSTSMTFAISPRWACKRSSMTKSPNALTPKVCMLHRMCNLPWHSTRILTEEHYPFPRAAVVELTHPDEQKVHTSITSPHYLVGNWLCDSLLYSLSHAHHCYHYFRFMAHRLYGCNWLLAWWSLQKDSLLAFKPGLLSHYGTSFLRDCNFPRQAQYGKARWHNSCKSY